MSMQTKTEFMSFNQRGDISTLNGRSLKLVDKFTYLGSRISSTENDINTWLVKAWTAIDQSYGSQTYQIKKAVFSKQRPCQYCCMDAPHGCWLGIWRESLTAITQECCKLYWTILGGNIPQRSSCMDTYHPSWRPSKLDMQDMWDTAGEVKVSS